MGKLTEKKKRLCAFPYVGGKNSQLGWLLPLLPECHHYCQPFGGSGAVLLNRERSKIETYNDIDDRVVTFFEVLRKMPKQLMHAIENTPYARQEFYRSLAVARESKLETARKFFVAVRQGWASVACGKRGWRTAVRSGSKAATFHNCTANLLAVRDRLRWVQIECRPALQVIATYDSPDTLFYCDPPYHPQTRCGGGVVLYRHEMTDEDHVTLVQALNRIAGRCAISGFRCALYDVMFARPKWRCIVRPPRELNINRGRNVEKTQRKSECLWINYDVKSGERL